MIRLTAASIITIPTARRPVSASPKTVKMCIRDRVTSLLAQAVLVHREITMDLAEKLVNQFIRTVKKEITLDYIKTVVCQSMNVDVTSLESKSRKRNIVQARQVAMYFAKSLTKNYSLQHIGSHIAGRDHSTVLHSCKAVANMMDTDKKFRSMVDEIKVKIVGNA